MPQVYSSKSTPFIFSDARSAELWQRHVVDGDQDIVVGRDEVGYITVREGSVLDYFGDNEDRNTYRDISQRFWPEFPSELDIIPAPDCRDRLSRIVAANAVVFAR